MHVVRAGMIAAACVLATAVPATRVAASDIVQRADVPRIAERLRAWLPEVRVDEDALARAWSAHGGPRCRLLTLLWRREVSSGTLEILREDRCRDDVQAFAPLALVECRLLVVGLDATRSVVWWTQLRDPRQTRPAPAPAPPTGDPAADRESQRLHARTLIASSAMFHLAISGDPRIARLDWLEPAGCEPGHAMRPIGSIAVAPRAATAGAGEAR